jgi:nicotinate-nucleotide adenylyltransferase
MTVGLFGGTFDPIHLGHLDVVHAARLALNLEQVWLVPSRWPPHRAAPHVSAAHRFAMAALAIQQEHGVLVSDLEMDAAGPSYTVDTLSRFTQRYGQAHRPVFIIGADAFRDIGSWKAYPRVLDQCHFAVVSRPGLAVSELPALLPGLARRMCSAPCELPHRPGILLVDAPTGAVSSTAVRDAAAHGRSLGGLVPAGVGEYILRHGFYRGTPAVE